MICGLDEESGVDYCCCEPNLFIAMQKMEKMIMRHRAPENISDDIALGITLTLRFFADTFFAKRYGHRAVVLETVAGVPGMVAGM